jgi:hypothetical protein
MLTGKWGPGRKSNDEQGDGGELRKEVLFFFGGKVRGKPRSMNVLKRVHRVFKPPKARCKGV